MMDAINRRKYRTKVPDESVAMKNWRITLSLFLIYFLFAILLNSVGTVILQVIHHYDVTKPGASILEAFKDLSIAAVSFVAAAFLPRVGYRRSMLIALGVVGMACIAMPLLPSFLTTKLFFMCAGMSFALVKVSVYSSIGLLTHDEKEHAQLMNLLEGTFMIGVLSGYWLFSAFIDSENVRSDSWLGVYWVLAGLCAVIFLLLVGAELDESQARPLQDGSEAQGFLAMLVLLGKPVVYVFLVSAFLSVLIEQGVTSWLPTFNNEILKLPLAMSVQVTSILAASTAIGRLSFGVLVRKISWYALLNICVIAMGVLVLLTLPLARGMVAGQVHDWGSAPLAAFVFPLIGLFMAPIYPVINSLILSALPKHRHAAMTGLIVIFSALGGTTGSLITGFAFARLSGEVAFYLTLAPMTVILGALFLFRRELDRRHVAQGGELLQGGAAH
jgi:FHS family glucose/mannose:H+ symporter-like MFS transporter